MFFKKKRGAGGGQDTKCQTAELTMIQQLQLVRSVNSAFSLQNTFRQ